MKSCYGIVIGLVFLTAFAALPESPNGSETGHDCDCNDPGTSAGCTDCPTLQDSPVCESLSEDALKRCHCVERTGANRAKRHFVYVHSPDKLVKCQCRVHSSKVFSFDFCPTDKDILAKEDDGYDHTEKIDMFTRFNGPSFTAEEFDSEDFKCDPTEQFQVDCNICWCNKRGDGAKYCTRVACNPKSYPPLQA